MDHFARTQVVAADVGEDSAQLVASIRAGLEDEVRGVRIAQDCAERLVDLVRDGTRQFPSHRKARRTRKIDALRELSLFGHAAPATLIEQRRDKQCLSDDDRQRNGNLPPVLAPEGHGREANLASVGQAPLVQRPALQCTSVGNAPARHI